MASSLGGTCAIRPQQLPDFHQQLFVQLRSECHAFQKSVPDVGQLSRHLQRLRHALALFERPAVVRVCDELLQLLNHAAKHAFSTAEVAQTNSVLQKFGAQLHDHLQQIQQVDSVDCALAFLPLINACRSLCAREPATTLSVATEGIALSVHSDLPQPTPFEVERFVYRVSESLAPLRHCLLQWFRQSPASEQELRVLFDVFERLAASVEVSNSLRIFHPVFAAATCVMAAVEEKRLPVDNSLQRVFSRLERWLQGLTRLELSALVEPQGHRPDHLLRQLLYYVGTAPDQQKTSRQLRQAYRLDRFAPATDTSSLHSHRAVELDATDNILGQAQQMCMQSAITSIDALEPAVVNMFGRGVDENAQHMVDTLYHMQRVLQLVRLPEAALLTGQLAGLLARNMAVFQNSDSSVTDAHAALADTLIAVSFYLHGVQFQSKTAYGMLHVATQALASLQRLLIDLPQESSDEKSLHVVFADEAYGLVSALSEATTRLDTAPVQPSSRQSASEDILGLLHTLKGSARVASDDQLADAAHQLETELLQCSGIDQWSRVLDKALPGMRTQVLHSVSDTRLEQRAKPVDAAGEDGHRVDTYSEDFSASVRRGSSVFADIMVNANAASASRARLRDHLQGLQIASSQYNEMVDRIALNADAQASSLLKSELQLARHRQVAELAAAEKECLLGERAGAKLQQSLINAHTVPIGHVQDRMQRIVEDAADATCKRVSLKVFGGQTPIDNHLLSDLLPSLEHLLRNAVLHGIETPELRESSGKPVCGEVCVDVRNDGVHLNIVVSDDGGGIDMDAVNQHRSDRRLPILGEHDDWYSTLTEIGYSTKDHVTPMAGRGLGLASLRHLVDSQEGVGHITTRHGKGTTITLRFEQPAGVQHVAVVCVGEKWFGLPASCIDWGHDADVESAVAGRGSRPVTVKSDHHRWVVYVDRWLGYREIILQPLGVQIASLGAYLGGAVLADGQSVLVLDPAYVNQLLPGKPRFRLMKPDPLVRGNPARALIVDDSPTVRRATREILEAFGYIVDEAVSGREALTCLELDFPELVLLDIEMPGIDGFGVMSQIKAQAIHAEGLIIMFSSRAGDSEKRRARLAGVATVLKKPLAPEQLGRTLIRHGLYAPDICLS